MALLRRGTYLQPATLVQVKFAQPGRADPAQILPLRLKSHILYSECYVSNPNGQSAPNWVASLEFKFENDPTVNESRIVVLVEQF